MCRATTTHIRATLVDISPPVMDMRGASLSFMNKDDETHGYTLTRREPWYIDVFDYNSKDETSGAPVLFLYNKSPRPPWESVPVRSYVVTILASGYRGGVRKRFWFALDGVTPPTFLRLYWWSRPSV